MVTLGTFKITFLFVGTAVFHVTDCSVEWRVERDVITHKEPDDGLT
jgi:hypothetical protein